MGRYGGLFAETAGSPLQEEDLVLFTGGKFYSYNASFHPNIKFNAGG